jgi:putative FmdB family regulatory protein
MPLYEYRCEKCEGVIEVLQKHSAKPLTVHDTCGGPLERLISTSALHFKGSGWYVTDYGRSRKRDGSDPKSAKDDSKPSKDDSKSARDDSKAAKPASDAKSESAPAKPAETKS